MWGWLVRMRKEARWQPAMAMAAAGSNPMLLTPSLAACVCGYGVSDAITTVQ
jgi:hypothetical protein